MKTPAPPPDFGALLDALLASERASKVVLASTEIPLAGDYLPWDSLRFKEPPQDLSHEEWWIATRLARRNVQRVIPQLRAMDGRPFHYALPDAVLRDADHVTRNASGQIAISAQVTNPATRERYLVSSLIEEAITSSQLEGAATSRRDAKEMLRTGREPRDNSERMIRNNYLAMQRITHLRGEKLTPALICEIHRIVTEGTLENPEDAGRIQTDDASRVSVWGDGDQLLHRPPPVGELAGRMQALCEVANGVDTTTYMPPVLRAIALHFMMGYDHYFEDGNGRTARAIFYWSMLNQGYWLTEFLTISKILKAAPAQYARSFLLTEQDEGDLTYFFLFHLRVLRRAIDDLHVYLAQKADELRTVQSTIHAAPGELNYRQLALLDRALRDETTVYTAKSHAASHGTTIETARQDLLALEDKGYLQRSKIGRQFTWKPASDLAARLQTTS